MKKYLLLTFVCSVLGIHHMNPESLEELSIESFTTVLPREQRDSIDVFIDREVGEPLEAFVASTKIIDETELGEFSTGPQVEKLDSRPNEGRIMRYQIVNQTSVTLRFRLGFLKEDGKSSWFEKEQIVSPSESAIWRTRCPPAGNVRIVGFDRESSEMSQLWSNPPVEVRSEHDRDEHPHTITKTFLLR